MTEPLHNALVVTAYFVVEIAQFAGLFWIAVRAKMLTLAHRDIASNYRDIIGRLRRGDAKFDAYEQKQRHQDEAIIALTREVQSLPTALQVMQRQQTEEIKNHISLQVQEVRTGLVGLARRVGTLEEARYHEATGGKPPNGTH